MKNAVSIADVPNLTKEDIFDLESAYVLALSERPADNTRQGCFHPSEVGWCRRRAVYGYIRAPSVHTVDPDAVEIFDLGHAIHELVGKKLESVAKVLKPKNIGSELKREVKFDPKWDKLFSDLGIGGTTDGILRVWADTWEQRSIIEAKSVNRRNFEIILGQNHPKKEHLMQAHLYAYRYDCPIIYVWYYCKDNSKRCVFPSLFDRNVFNEAISYFEVLLKHVEAGTLPDRDEDFFECPRCQYREICNPDLLTQIRKKDEEALDAIRARGRL